MNRLPIEFLKSLQHTNGFDHNAFVEVHESGEQVTSVRLHPLKGAVDNDLFSISAPVPWTCWGYYLHKRPSFTFDPLFHAGCYYVQEASSMFLEQAFAQLTDTTRPLKILDLCGAPGGKSTHIQSLMSDESVLVSNEVIRNRSLVLTDNIIKWGTTNVIVSNNDPSVFGKLQGYFDAITVDAPCSGSGLFRRDETAIEEWSLNNVQLCCQRQKRILADVLPALKEDGLLIYSTCSYSMEEDEDIADWLIDEMEMENLSLSIPDSWNIIKSLSEKGAEGYRFYPDKVRGEGFFMCCFRKKNHAAQQKLKPYKAEKVSTEEKRIIAEWIRPDQLEIISYKDQFVALTPQALQVFLDLKNVVYLQYMGVALGKIMKNRLVPEHALALSSLYSENILSNELSYDDAIKYLQKKEVDFNISDKGWQFVQYKGYNLGWINVLSNRVNNYYPKELRILKQSNDAVF